MAKINLDEAIRQFQQAADAHHAGLDQISENLLGGLIDTDAWDEAAEQLGSQFRAAIDKACDAGASLNLLRGLLGLEQK